TPSRCRHASDDAAHRALNRDCGAGHERRSRCTDRSRAFLHPSPARGPLRGPTLRGSLLHAPALRRCLLRPTLGSTALRGSLLHGPTLGSTALRRCLLHGPTLRGSLLHGPTLGSTALRRCLLPDVRRRLS